MQYCNIRSSCILHFYTAWMFVKHKIVANGLYSYRSLTESNLLDPICVIYVSLVEALSLGTKQALVHNRI